jgi:hypothetical protein
MALMFNWPDREISLKNSPLGRFDLRGGHPPSPANDRAKRTRPSGPASNVAHRMGAWPDREISLKNSHFGYRLGALISGAATRGFAAAAGVGC